MGTIGVENSHKNITVRDRPVRLALWDSGGQERFLQMTMNLLKGIQGICLVFDSTDEESFANIKNWISQIRCSAPEAKIVLLCNKVDMEQARVVTAIQGQELAGQYDVPFFETSAITGQNLEVVFRTLA